jgi:hypothetical protein
MKGKTEGSKRFAYTAWTDASLYTIASRIGELRALIEPE